MAGGRQSVQARDARDVGPVSDVASRVFHLEIITSTRLITLPTTTSTKRPFARLQALERKARRSPSPSASIAAWLARTDPAPTSPTSPTPMADDGFGFGSAAPIADDDESSPSSPTAPIDVPPASQARAELLHAPVPRRRAFLARLTPAALAYYNLSDALTLLGVLTRVPEGEPVGRALVAADEERAPEDRLGVLEHAVNWLAHEARKASAPGDALVLLGWVCTLWDLVLARGTIPTSSPLLPTHLTTAAVLLATVLASGKPGARHGATTRVRRAMRNAKDTLPDTIDALTSLASAKPTPGKIADPTTVLPLLGVAVGVTLRLKPTPGTISEAQKTALTLLYTTLVLPSRTPLPPYVLEAFDDWAAHLLNETDLDKLADAADKALMRAPEGAAVALTRLVKTYTHPASIPTNDPAPARRQLPKTFVDKLLPAVVNLARGVGAPAVERHEI
ncbi:hypothetical protein EV715DRAFT_298293 [Schizophyllum commune]